MSFTRRQILTAAASVAALSMAPCAFAAPKSVRIAVGGKALYYYLPISIAERLGYFKDEGLDVEIIDFQGGSRSLQAVVGGSADVVSGAFEHTLAMQARGQAMQAFVLQGRAPQCVFAVSRKTMPNFKSLADLKGKRIGVSGLELARHRHLHPVECGPQIQRRLLHRRGRLVGCRGRDALGSDRRLREP